VCLSDLIICNLNLMSDTGLKAPPKANSANQHRRRASFHARRRSQHSIASFGDIEDVIKTPSLGVLSETTENEDPSDVSVGALKGKKKHGRKSSNVHELFGNSAEDDFDVENLRIDDLGDGSFDSISDEDIENYSPGPLRLDDASPSPEREILKTGGGRRKQSFGGIVDLFGEDELEGTAHLKQQIKHLTLENEDLARKLRESENERRRLEQNISTLQGGTVQRELESVKKSKIQLIISTGKEIDRLRREIDRLR